MLCTDSVDDVSLLIAVTRSKYIPAPNINVVRFRQVAQEAFPLNCRVRFTLCPQGRCAFSTDGNVKPLFDRCFHRLLYKRRVRVSHVQGDITSLLNGNRGVQAASLQATKNVGAM